MCVQQRQQHELMEKMSQIKAHNDKLRARLQIEVTKAQVCMCIII